MELQSQQPDHLKCSTASHFLQALARIIQAESRHSASLVKNQHVTRPQLFVLKTVADAEEPTVTLVADKLRLSGPTVSKIVQRLVARGLLSRQKTPNDQRQSRLSLTVAGETILRATPSLLAPHFLERLKTLPDWQVCMVSKGLRRVAELMR